MKDRGVAIRVKGWLSRPVSSSGGVSPGVWLVWPLLLLLVGCQQSQPASTVKAVVAAPTLTPSVTPQLSVPTALAAAPPTAVNTATHTPAPTATVSPTAAPLVQIWVVDEISGEPVSEAVVHLALFRQTTDELGQALFRRAHALSEPYPVRVTAAGYHAAQTALIVGQGVTELTVALEPGIFARVIAAVAVLRGGPGLVYPAVAEVAADDLLLVIGQSDDGNWVVVETVAGGTAWLAAVDAALEGNLAAAVTVAAPATPTPRPTTAPIVSAPPAGSPPLGPNLLVNPGFEFDTDAWRATIWNIQSWKLPVSLNDGRFVRSGGWAMRGQHQERFYIHQNVIGVTPQQTYRFGAWVTAWSSTEDDPNLSINPANLSVQTCIDTNGDDNRWLPTTVCSSSYRPLDTWQYITVDAVAGTDRITVFLVSSVTEGSAAQTYISWDDTYLGVAPTAATPTPPPPLPPTRPQPMPFTPNEMINSMNELRSTLENTGGLLDRLYQGTGATCAEFENLYRQLIVSKTYHSIPGEWQTIYNDYLWAAEHALATNDAIYALCTGEGRRLLTFFNYSVGRTGINDSLSRLIPAIEAANRLLNP